MLARANQGGATVRVRVPITDDDIRPGGGGGGGGGRGARMLEDGYEYDESRVTQTYNTVAIRYGIRIASVSSSSCMRPAADDEFYTSTVLVSAG